MTIDRATKPKEKGKIKFHLPTIKRFTLSNGLKIIFVEKNNLPIIQFSFISQAGSKNDPTGKKGLAYLTSLLIDEGAGKFDALQLDDEIESLGSILKCSADQDSFSISILSLKENLKKSLNILSLIITQPRFEEPDFIREKQKLLTKILQLRDNPEYIASSAFRKILYKDSPYFSSTIGYYKDVENIKPEDVKEFYKQNITIDNSTLVVVGKIKIDELKNLVEKNFNNWETKEHKKLQLNNITPTKANYYFVHKDGAAQSQLRIGMISKSRNSKDFYARTIMNSILGGQFSSRINLNLREDKGFTYGASSSYQYNKHSGSFIVSTGVQSVHTGESISEILKELKEIRKNITHDEVNFSKSYLIKRYPALFETYSQVASNLMLLIIHDLPDNYFDTYIENLEKVNSNEILKAAKENILLDQIAILAVGDRKIVLPQLEKLSDGKIIELEI
ncbi:peptidase M16 inactive domain protein [bacterium BMS3Abin04]|nr:peptidase M16 inactive domain protein [bacterium BMS3Abin04]